jgi:glutathione synthase/RimK-type ligase-like ATP-grasp enzyme
MDECATIGGGLTLFAIDVLHLRDGSDVILEMNDTAFGLMFEHEAEDIGYIKQLMLQRLNESV